MPQQMRGMPSPIQASKSPAKTYQLTHAVTTNKAGAGGALQGSWDVPSAHSIDRSGNSYSVTDQFAAAQSIQRMARGKEIRGIALSPGATGNDVRAFKEYVTHPSPPPGSPPQGPDAFAIKDAYAQSPYGEGYAFVNNPHDQFGSTMGFNESKTSNLADPKPTAQMRVKSGYTGHVPKGRDHIGSTYRMHDNRGTAGKTMVPIPHKDISPPNDEYAAAPRALSFFSCSSRALCSLSLSHAISLLPVLYRYLAKMKRNLTYHSGQSAVFQGRMTSHTDQELGSDGFGDATDGASTVKIPERIEKLLEQEDMKGPDGTVATADIGDGHDAKYIKGTGAANRMVGYTGHVPRAREVVGSTVYGPTIGASYHGPAMEPDPMGFVPPSSPNKVADCP